MDKLSEFLEEFKRIFPNRKILFLCQAGSHFFNLEGPNSDLDYKGIYLPSPEEYVKGECRRKFFERKTQSAKNVKNTNKDVDLYLYSITSYLDLLGRGDFNCMELLYTPSDKILQTSTLYEEIRNIRESLLIKDISSFLGFVKKEYKKYGINAYHYSQQDDFKNFLLSFEKSSTLKDIWGDVENYAEANNYLKITTSLTGNKVYVPTISLAQRLYQSTVKIGYILNALEQRLKTYGHRQKSVLSNNVEYKGLYHALRLMYEASDILKEGKLNIPFSKDRYNLLLKVKNGNIDKDSLFTLINRELDNLTLLENNVTIDNKKQVRDIVDKLLFKISGREELRYYGVI